MTSRRSNIITEITISINFFYNRKIVVLESLKQSPFKTSVGQSLITFTCKQFHTYYKLYHPLLFFFSAYNDLTTYNFHKTCLFVHYACIHHKTKYAPFIHRLYRISFSNKHYTTFSPSPFPKD